MSNETTPTNHTPGPWATHPLKAQVDAFDGPGGAPLPVCQMLWPTELRGEAETFANAELIAAAPQMAARIAELEHQLGQATATVGLTLRQFQVANWSRRQSCEAIRRNDIKDKLREEIGELLDELDGESPGGIASESGDVIAMVFCLLSECGIDAETAIVEKFNQASAKYGSDVVLPRPRSLSAPSEVPA